MELSEEAKEVRRDYFRNYYKENKERIRENNKQWKQQNHEAVKQHQINYWNRKADELEVAK